jgi:hypothetical protein
MFVIITTGINGAKTELCRVERNAEQIAQAARNKCLRIGKRKIKQYLNVEVVELRGHSS